MGTFRITLDIGDPQGQRYESVEALVDTGATFTVAPASLLVRLGVVPQRRVSFELADGSVRELDVGRTWVRVNDKADLTLVVFGEEGTPPLLGAYTLEGLLLAPEPVHQRLVPVRGLLM